MSKQKIVPVLMAGGSGTRLWPLSRKSYPKQFSNLVGEETLFQKSALRLVSSSILQFEPSITMTNSDFRFVVTEQLQEVGIDPGQILIEPSAKNTAPAILAACLCAIEKNPEAILLVAPSDHIIPDKEAFHKAINQGLKHIDSEKMVIFGISPTQPKTGYGYLELQAGELDNDGTCNVINFIEKPQKKSAKKMLDSGNYLWNAGIFMFKASDMIRAFKVFAKETLKLTTNSLKTAEVDLGFLRLNPQFWDKITPISIDYLIMEKAENLVAVRFNSKWSDLGGWDSVWSELDQNEFGVASTKGAHAIDCSNTLLRSESVGQQLVGLGLKDILAVAMSDAVLVVHKDRAQDVKNVVEYLKKNKVPQAEIFPKDYRPWGWFESLVLSDHFQVKRIFVKPKAALSLQSHKYRSEHWVVVKGTAKVTVDSNIQLVGKGKSVYVPLGAIHRLENPKEEPMILIEVQTGSYLGEDDIVRYEDLYARK